jgi:RNA polymerase sigma factor (sigma-70 family)
MAILDQRSRDSSQYKNKSNIVDAYLNEIGSYNLLTREQEIEQFGYIDEGVRVYESTDFTEELSEQQVDAFSKLTAAYQVVVLANLRLVVRFTKPHFKDKPLPIMDLISEGNVALARAACEFDISEGFRFSSYAVPAIRRHVRRAIDYKARMIHLPQRDYSRYLDARASLQELTRTLGRPPTNREKEAGTGMTQQAFSKFAMLAKTHLPQDADMRWGGEDIADYVVDQLSAQQEIKDIFQTAGLNSQEMLALGYKFNLDPRFLHELTSEFTPVSTDTQIIETSNTDFKRVEETALDKARVAGVDFEQVKD